MSTVGEDVHDTTNHTLENTIDPALLTTPVTSEPDLYGGLELMLAGLNYSSAELGSGCEPPAAPSYDSYAFEQSVESAPMPLDLNSQTPGDTSKYRIESSRDIVSYYYTCFDFTAPHQEIRALWNAATQYATEICEAVTELCNNHLYWHGDWYSRVLTNRGWMAYSRSKLEKPDLVPWFPDPPLNLDNYLTELNETYDIMDALRIRSIIDCHFDPEQHGAQALLMEHDTSDSCGVAEDDDSCYREMRESLQAFQRDADRSLYKTGPVWDTRLRKDIRAWARIARLRCIKLPCSSMLISKYPHLLPQRQRRKRPSGREQRGDVLECEEDRACTPVGRDPIHSDRRNQTYAMQNRQAQSVWEPRYNNFDYQSGDSSASWSSASSTGVRGKKRRLPRDEGGYACDFLGCQRVFDRKCDLTHHQRNHRPKDSLPYACEHCGQRYAWPKDLRRHEKTHQSRGSATSDGP